jgi:hypothetical protein
MTALQGDLQQANIPYLGLAVLVNSLGPVGCKKGAGGRPDRERARIQVWR